MKALAARIAEQPFFQGMTSEHLTILGDCAMATQFTQGQMIVSENDLANRFYVLEAGRVALEFRRDDGGQVLVETLGPGEALGWSWLFPPYRWHFDARALEDTTAIFFYGTRLRAACDEDHDFGYELIRRMAQVAVLRLEIARRHLASIVGYSGSGIGNAPPS